MNMVYSLNHTLRRDIKVALKAVKHVLLVFNLKILQTPRHFHLFLKQINNLLINN
jgi:hypothetical protein